MYKKGQKNRAFGPNISKLFLSDLGLQPPLTENPSAQKKPLRNWGGTPSSSKGFMKFGYWNPKK